jgi:hypothetical protein
MRLLAAEASADDLARASVDFIGSRLFWRRALPNSSAEALTRGVTLEDILDPRINACDLVEKLTGETTDEASWNDSVERCEVPRLSTVHKTTIGTGKPFRKE